MVERCPCCGADVVFSGDLCPACGHSSPRSDRVQPSRLARERAESAVPTYTAHLEHVLNPREERGRLVFWLAAGLLLIPDIGGSVVPLFFLRPQWWSFLRLGLGVGLLIRSWHGRRGGRLSVGAWGLVLAVVGGVGAAEAFAGEEMELGILWCGAVVFAACSGAAFLLSKDLSEFVRRRHSRN
jgi:hypothetical protein